LDGSGRSPKGITVRWDLNLSSEGTSEKNWGGVGLEFDQVTGRKNRGEVGLGEGEKKQLLAGCEETPNS